MVEISTELAAVARRSLPSTALPGAEWAVACAQAAHAMGCNPGGEMLASVVDAAIPLERWKLYTDKKALTKIAPHGGWARL